MPDIPLKDLQLQGKWPHLAELQDEVAVLGQRLREAQLQVQQLQAQLGPAREEHLNREAEAIRKGEKAPEPVSEKKIQAKLEGGERNQRVLTRALEAAHQDMGTLVEKHRNELFEDVRARRAEIAAAVAEAAREALAAFGRYESLHYVLKDLQPPQQSAEYSGPARDTTTVVGVQTRRQGGPARGQVEAMLSYLIGLAASEPGGGANAAREAEAS